MKKDENAFIKILIVLVIASLALLAIVYFMMKADKNVNYISDEELVTWPKTSKILLSEAEDDFKEEKCEASAWTLGEEKEYEYIGEDVGIKFKYLNREFSNDDLIAEPYKIKKDEDGEFELFVVYWPEGTDTYPCNGGVGVSYRLALIITDNAVGFEEFDSKGEINGIEYLETIRPGLGEYDQFIKRVVLENGKAYIFSSSIIEERDVEGKNGEMIHIGAFDGEAQLDYVFENLEFIEDLNIE